MGHGLHHIHPMDGWLGHCNKAICGKTLKEKQRVLIAG